MAEGAEGTTNRGPASTNNKEDKGRTEGGIPGIKPPTMEQLPPEERFQLQDQGLKDEDSGLYGEFTPEDKAQARGAAVFDQEENALDWFQKKTTEGFKFWAQFTRYKIKMDDGRVITYERRPITKYQTDELLDISAEIQGMKTLDTEKPLSTTQVRQKQRLLDQLKAKYYLFNTETKKPMSAAELYHVADGTIIDSILEACFAITVAKWAEGKK